MAKKNVINVNYVTKVIKVEEARKKSLWYNINKIYILFILYHRVLTATFFINDIRDIVDLNDILRLWEC